MFGVLHFQRGLEVADRSRLPVQFRDGHIGFEIPRRVRQLPQNLPGRGVPAIAPLLSAFGRDHYLRLEESIKILGVEGIQIGTYVASPKPDGSVDEFGEGVISTADSIVTWKGVGAGKLGAGGAVSYRGGLSFSTSAAKFTSLNSEAGVFEFEVDAAGNTHFENLGLEVAPQSACLRARFRSRTVRIRTEPRP